MKLSIIILSYNTQDLLRQCLESINQQTYKASDLEIIVIDNASTDGSVAMLRQEFPQANLILNSQNRGFAAANNQGLKLAQGEYVLLLNSDTQLTAPKTLAQLCQFMAHQTHAALVTPKVVLPNGNLDWACHRGLPNPWNAFTYFTKLEKLFPRSPLFTGYHRSYQDLTVAHQLGATAATAILVRKKAIDEVGFLDERFFLYGEDLDWCKRFTDAGWEIWYYPQVVVYHHKSASGKRKVSDPTIKKASTDHFYATMKQFYEKHYQDTYPKWLRRLVYWGIDLKQKLT